MWEGIYRDTHLLLYTLKHLPFCGLDSTSCILGKIAEKRPIPTGDS